MSHAASPPPPRFLRLPEVIQLVGLQRDAIYKLEREGDFPRRRKITPRASAWREDELVKWMNSRPIASPANEDSDFPPAA